MKQTSWLGTVLTMLIIIIVLCAVALMVLHQANKELKRELSSTPPVIIQVPVYIDRYYYLTDDEMFVLTVHADTADLCYLKGDGSPKLIKAVVSGY